MNKCLQQGLLSTLIISLVACGGGGGSKSPTTPSSAAPSSVTVSSSSVTVSSSSVEASSSVVSSATSSSVESSSTSENSSSVAPTVETTFTVRITPPQLDDGTEVLKSGRTAAIKKAEDLNQLAVVVVDLAGNVVDTIPLDETNSTKNPDGSWSIRVPGYPQLDCIVIANLDGPITVFEKGDNVFDSDLLFAPTTGEDLEVSLASTAAYQNFLDALGGEGTFESLELDVTDPTQLAVLENLIQTISDVLSDQVFVGADSITEALAQVQGQVQAIVQVEAVNITAPAVDSTLATAATAGNIYWFEAFLSDGIFYGVLSQTEDENEFIYEGEQFELVDYADSGELMLHDGAWVVTDDNLRVSALNQDGSITLANTSEIRQFNVKATQTINLAARNIASFLNAYGDMRGMVASLNPDAVFAGSALVYRANLTATADAINLWYEPGDETGVCPWDSSKNANDYGGNCETLGAWQWVENQSYPNYNSAQNSLAKIKSADVAMREPGSVMMPISWRGSEAITVQLINNSAKTANYYSYDFNEVEPIFLGSGTWAEFNLPGMQGENATAISINIPAAVISEGDFNDEDRRMIFAVHEGYVRIGHQQTAGDVFQTGLLIYNSSAADSILGAFDYQPAIAGAWVIGGDYVMFRKNGTFAQVKISNEDPNCQIGFAYGQYSWNTTTGAFSTEIDEDTTAVDPQDSCSVADIETLTITDTTMTLTEGEDTFALTKVIPSESAPLAGAWIVNGDWLVFTSDNTYVHAKTENDDSNCRTGWANGNFTWDAGTGLFTATIEQDFTDDFEESNCTLDGEVDVALDGNSLHFSAEDDEFTLKRFGNPLN